MKDVDMVKEIKYVGLRITPEMHEKLVYIAKYDARTINSLALNLFNKCIRDFEKEHGPIQSEDMDN